MTKSIQWLLPLALVLWLGYEYFSKNTQEVHAANSTTTKPQELQGQPAERAHLHEVQSAEVKEALPVEKLAPVEAQALEQMTSFLADFTEGPRPLEELVQALNEAGQKPVATSQENPDTGEMVIVRTENPPAGTRYFHAQVFRDKNNQDLMQHLSFEFRKGEGAMEHVMGALKNSFNDLPATPSETNPRFSSWKLRDGYVLWVKKLEASDLEADPFNSYTSEDVGTVRVAIEVDVHGG